MTRTQDLGSVSTPGGTGPIDVPACWQIFEAVVGRADRIYLVENGGVRRVEAAQLTGPETTANAH